MAAKFVSAAQAELACGVCFQFFVKPHEPKNLPKCPHILCQICVQKMIEGGLKTIKCPQCNKISPLPEEGIEGLTISLALRNLAERHPEGIKQYKEYMQNQLQCGQEKTATRVAKLKELIKQTQHAIQVEEQEIEKTVETVMMKAQDLIAQLKNTSGLDQLLNQLANLETEMKYIETSQSKLKTMTDDKFHAQTDAITNQVEKLKIDEVMDNIKSPCVGKFIANIKLGRIVKPRQLELVQEFGEFEGASGIASDSNGILDVSDYHSKPQQVSVFHKDKTEYKQQSKFPIRSWSKKLPLDIAIYEDKYLVTKCAMGFDVYSSNGKFQHTKTVMGKQSGQEKIDVLSGSLCSTKYGKIIVSSDVRIEGEELLNGMVTVHDTEGSIMKTIPVGNNPSRCIDINGTHVAVSDTMGNNVYVCDMKTGKDTLRIDVQMPYGICYDEQSDCLLIGRMTKSNTRGELLLGSCVIDQYCMITGKLVACLAHGLQGPLGLTMTDDNMLAVADSKTVKLYNLGWNLAI